MAKTDAEINSCWYAMFQLRPHLKHEDFLTQIKAMQSECYVLLHLSGGEKPCLLWVIAFILYCIVANVVYRPPIDLGKLQKKRLCFHIAATYLPDCIKRKLHFGTVRQ